MKFAYADPPYLGQGQRLYQHPEWDDVGRHIELLEELARDYDGWAFSLNTPSLAAILAKAPACRVASWVKSYVNFGFARPVYAWEPVLFVPLRENDTWDWFKCAVTRKTGTIGAKPPAFCHWMFRLLGAEPEDEFVDVFPGSGNVTKAWAQWRGQHTLSLREGAPPP